MSAIAVDFDGVIHAYSKGWQDGAIYDPPLPGAFDALHFLMRQHAVFIHTARDPRQVADWITVKSNITTCTEPPTGPQYAAPMEFWNDQTRLLVTSRKLPAVAYIDDRGIRFADWDQTLNALHVLGLWSPA
ncbi:hypothetical protein AB0M61_01490 [Streptomyces sp. NPDC051642]|uniref:hypothetical protein n=1 Tax=Streptomyces sp. NPDC051642 TaxID=3154646 RepID=UPI00344AD6F9